MERRISKNRAIARFTFMLRALILLGIGVFTASPLASAPRFSDWSAPQNLGPMVNSASVDVGPAISKDGLSLYFTSNRPGGFGNFDIWVTQRDSVDSPWKQPVNLGPAINTGALESIPALSRDGHWLFFNSDRPGGFGMVDVWASYRFDKLDDFGWQPPINLGPGVNSAFLDQGASFFENDDGGSPLLFFGSDRPGGSGLLDIYVSERMADGSFGNAKLIPELNTSRNDQRAVVRFDGLELFFFSDRTGVGNDDLFVSTRETVDDAWSEPMNLGPTVNSAFRDVQAYIASDRETLFFASNRPPADCPLGCGSFDLYVTTRTKIKGP
ncbi:MAG: hypothetical protein E6J65_04205 [Deltaproteobacteria bacterium]|jgi:hypothetical protein|nr:MAG: hypothetical protein E6J65_04205 [Deltaproteobacteria bacterium]